VHTIRVVVGIGTIAAGIGYGAIGPAALTGCVIVVGVVTCL